MIDYLTQHLNGKWVAVLAAVSVGYGWLILGVAPMWRRLAAAQGGAELQATFHYDATRVSQVFGAFDASLRSDALLFYTLDVPNAILFAASIAALIAFAIRHLDAACTALRWVVVLPLLSGASDLIENANLAAALLISPSGPSLFGTVAGVATAVKLTTGQLSIVLMLILLVTAGVRAMWRRRRAE